MKIRFRIFGVGFSLFVLMLSLAVARADGTESLGTPIDPVTEIPLTIASGSGMVAEGTGLGLVGQPGIINITVPPGATVNQALLYWQGQSQFDQELGDMGDGDDTISVNGIDVTGDLIGGPAFYVFYNDRYYQTSSFRADITGLTDSTGSKMVQPGDNELIIDGFDSPINFLSDGASILVIYDDGTGAAEIDVRDGNDFAFLYREGDQSTTNPQTFTFAPADTDRTADLMVAIGDLENKGEDRPNAIKITTGGITQVLENLLDGTDGVEWDTLTIPVAIPKTATDLTVQALSYDDGSGNKPASLIWVVTALSVPKPEIGPGVWSIEPGNCVVIIDEDGIDNDMSSIEQAAASHGVESDYLVNDDMPTEGKNPPLRWNEHFPGDVVLLPTGQVEDEGWYALQKIPRGRWRTSWLAHCRRTSWTRFQRSCPYAIRNWRIWWDKPAWPWCTTVTSA